jgi:acyl carrier protein
MTRTIAEIAAEVFQMPPESLRPEMTPDDITGWDSLAHLRLITAIEAEYNIRFSMQQVQSIGCLQDFEKAAAA